MTTSWGDVGFGQVMVWSGRGNGIGGGSAFCGCAQTVFTLENESATIVTTQISLVVGFIILLSRVLEFVFKTAN